MVTPQRSRSILSLPSINKINRNEDNPSELGYRTYVPRLDDRDAASDLLTKIIGKLDEPYSLHGEPQSDAWGAAVWVKLAEEGREQYLRVQVMPWK